MHTQHTHTTHTHTHTHTHMHAHTTYTHTTYTHTCTETQSILEYNGAGIVAMVGKECVAIAADRRLGIQAQTVSTTFQKIYQMNDKLFVGLPGLATDVLTV